MNWLDMLPPHLQPDTATASRLERFRLEIGAPEQLFAMRIAGSPWALMRTLEDSYSRAKAALPNATEEQLLQEVYEARRAAAAVNGIVYPELNRPVHDVCALAQVCRQIEATWAHLAQPDTFGHGARIDAILEGKP